MKNFFISYNRADQTWAEWIAWVLEEQGYTAVIDVWDFRPGSNFALAMQEAAAGAQVTVMVLSEHYLQGLYTQPEWAAAFAQDPTGAERRLLPIRVGECQPTGLLRPQIYVDLVGQSEAEAERLLLNALKERGKPDLRPSFPGGTPTAERVTPQKGTFPGKSSCVNNLPRSGAVAFVGRDEDLKQLHEQLQQTERLAITAIRGMGGIGKTELALQYAKAQLKANTYPGGICWLSAKEQNLGTEIVNFATDQLQLAVPTDIDLGRQAQLCWRQWPTAGEVLVVIDDVSGRDDIAAYRTIQPYLPPDQSRFTVLLTTRLHLGASIRSFEIKVLSEAAALALLASLIGAERLDAEREIAAALCEWLGYLPLGLELVGRFLQRKPTWTLAQLQARLEAERLAARALGQARPDMTADHESVAAAFELSWQDLDAPVQALAYRLSLFALAPIPWGWLVEWADNTDPDDLEDWRDEGLINRSLLNWVGSDTVQLHQLIREFFRHKLEGWAEAEGLKRDYCQRMVSLAEQIPQTPTRDQILALTPAIPHLAEAATTWQAWLADDSLDWPFIGLGRFYEGQGDYGQTEPWYQDGLAATRDRFGETHPAVATSLNNLAALYQSQGRYEAAEPLYQEALAMMKALLGEAHPLVATSLNNLAGLYESQGRYEAAEPLYQEALAMMKALLGETHPSVATSLNNLAGLYESQGRYEAAEPLYQEALAMMKALLGEAHPSVATSLNNLAGLYRSQGRYEAAEPLYQEALAMMKALLGEAHPSVATSLNNLAGLYRSQGRYEAAEPLYLQAMQIDVAALGEDHPDTAIDFANLAGLFTTLDRYTDAEGFYIMALSVFVQKLGEDHPYIQATWQGFFGLVAKVVEAGQSDLLSDHPLTQSLLQQLQQS
ncbi:tetratricopeptide repeat protein [Leptolyngbya iicbica]